MSSSSTRVVASVMAVLLGARLLGQLRYTREAVGRHPGQESAATTSR
jgi:hypothetical protein